MEEGNQSRDLLEETRRHLGQWEKLSLQVQPSGVTLDSARDAFSPDFYVASLVTQVASLVTQVSGEMPPPRRALWRLPTLVLRMTLILIFLPPF